MIQLLENSQLLNDFDFAGFNLLNSGEWLPAPPALVATDDPRMAGPRAILDGSVTDLSVAATAEISQGKLDFDGNIPGVWLGTAPGMAAQGNLTEFKAHKGVASGYVALDVNGRFSSAVLASTGPAAGTVTVVRLVMPAEFGVPDTINTSGTFAVAWADQPDQSWFGVNGGSTPSFLVEQLPAGLVPDLPGTKFGLGSFPVEHLPVATGLGVDHAKGILPDPGDGSSTGNATDYLGRDMRWRTMTLSVPYQPVLPSVQITIVAWYGDNAQVQVQCPQGNLFLQVLDPSAPPPVIPPFDPVSNPVLMLVAPGNTVQAYAAKAGWNNSEMTKLTIPQPP